ncbi:hypothetical protein [Nitrosomonas sp. Nm166]|uniref:hypothetical protein n=1 Tax=Nitrosomonas sp. Nm166 TaxID=1881054 RepID=UPI0008E82413|nr:hypothetical protein [Nitrosomonas sp. Nm166]SFF25424.1 hypothetical protein SAMN05428977_10882 [Nitrosomonas sp. Nm166]
MIEVLTSLLAGGLAGTVVAFLLKTWTEARAKASIEHEYNQRLEIFKRQLDERQKIALVSELLAEWIAVPRGEQIPKDRNRLLFEASLWLPPELAVELSKTLQLKPTAKSIFEIFLLARRQLTGDASLASEHITFWGPEFEKPSQPPYSHEGVTATQVMLTSVSNIRMNRTA